MADQSAVRPTADAPREPGVSPVNKKTKRPTTRANQITDDMARTSLSDAMFGDDYDEEEDGDYESDADDGGGPGERDAAEDTEISIDGESEGEDEGDEGDDGSDLDDFVVDTPDKADGQDEASDIDFVSQFTFIPHSHIDGYNAITGTKARSALTGCSKKSFKFMQKYYKGIPDYQGGFMPTSAANFLPWLHIATTNDPLVMQTYYNALNLPLVNAYERHMLPCSENSAYLIEGAEDGQFGMFKAVEYKYAFPLWVQQAVYIKACYDGVNALLGVQVHANVVKYACIAVRKALQDTLDRIQGHSILQEVASDFVRVPIPKEGSAEGEETLLAFPRSCAFDFLYRRSLVSAKNVLNPLDVMHADWVPKDINKSGRASIKRIIKYCDNMIEMTEAAVREEGIAGNKNGSIAAAYSDVLRSFCDFGVIITTLTYCIEKYMVKFRGLTQARLATTEAMHKYENSSGQGDLNSRLMTILAASATDCATQCIALRRTIGGCAEMRAYVGVLECQMQQIINSPPVADAYILMPLNTFYESTPNALIAQSLDRRLDHISKTTVDEVKFTTVSMQEVPSPTTSAVTEAEKVFIDAEKLMAANQPKEMIKMFRDQVTANQAKVKRTIDPVLRSADPLFKFYLDLAGKIDAMESGESEVVISFITDKFLSKKAAAATWELDVTSKPVEELLPVLADHAIRVETAECGHKIAESILAINAPLPRDASRTKEPSDFELAAAH